MYSQNVTRHIFFLQAMKCYFKGIIYIYNVLKVAKYTENSWHQVCEKGETISYTWVRNSIYYFLRTIKI